MEIKTPEQIAADYAKQQDYGLLLIPHVETSWETGYNHRQPEVDDLKRQMEDMQSRLIIAMGDVNHLEANLAAKEIEMEDWKTIANVYKQRNNELTDPPHPYKAMKELIEWIEANVDSATDDNGHSIPVLHYDEIIAKAKELEAANCDHKDCRNNSQYLRQNHSEDKLEKPERVRIVGWVQVTDDTE